MSIREILWSTLWGGKERVEAPMRKAKAAIESEHHRWFSREQRRPGSHVTSKAPEEIEQALAKVERRRRDAVSAYFAQEADPEITRERERLVAVAVEHMQALLNALPELHAFDAEYAAFALACGAWRPRPQPIDRKSMPTGDEGLLERLNAYLNHERNRTAVRPEPIRWLPPTTNPVRVPDESIAEVPVIHVDV